MDEDAEAQIEAVAVLGDPLTRALYRYVAHQGREVGRDEAAKALGVGGTRPRTVSTAWPTPVWWRWPTGA